MDKVILFGTYDFVGFKICEKLLLEGIQVVGYQFLNATDDNLFEDKKLLIGRNANFVETTYEEENFCIEENTEEDTVIVISLYDFYFSQNVERVNLDKLIEVNSKKIVCLLPIKFLFDFPTELKKKIFDLQKAGINIQCIYLPTIYGPWQPSTFLYQQAFLQDYTGMAPNLDKREDTQDAIYIDDAVEEIFWLMKSYENSSVRLESNSENQWQRGAKYLHIKNQVDNTESKEYSHPFENNLTSIKIEGKISIEAGLDLQKQHLSRTNKYKS